MSDAHPRKRHLALKAALVASLLVGATAAEAAQGVLTKRRVMERGPAADRSNGKLTLSWTQSPRSHKNRTKALVRRNGNTRRLNKRGTKGYSGGVDGRIVIYQQMNNGDSDLKRFNLKTGKRTNLSVNTGKWEWRPSNSGGWVLFGRDTRHDTVVLLNSKNGNTRTLSRMNKRKYFSAPGQVNGDYVTYEKCYPGSHCDVFRYRISTGNTTKIPGKRPVQYSSSVTPSGTVYFMGSGRSCGARVALYRRKNGNTTRIARLGRNMDSARTFVARRAGGGTDVYFERGRCGENDSFANQTNLNVYKVRG